MLEVRPKNSKINWSLVTAGLARKNNNSRSPGSNAMSLKRASDDVKHDKVRATGNVKMKTFFSHPVCSAGVKISLEARELFNPNFDFSSIMCQHKLKASFQLVNIQWVLACVIRIFFFFIKGKKKHQKGYLLKGVFLLNSKHLAIKYHLIINTCCVLYLYNLQ